MIADLTSQAPTAAVIRELVSSQLMELPDSFGPQEDLFSAGLDSMAIMQLLLILEEKFGVRIPMGEVTRENFGSTEAIAALIRQKVSAS